MGIIDLIFPKQCVGCGRIGGYWCAQCVKEAKLLFPQVCPVCERNALGGIKHTYCKEPFSPNGLISLWVYEGTPRRLITKIKYKFVYDAALSIALPATLILKKEKYLPQKDCLLVPIPLYWKRKNWRGFNQTEEIGKIIARSMGWKTANLLMRTKQTESQVGKNEKERRKNIEGVFRLIYTSTISNQSNIILFDDVWTTGATMFEATKVLKKAGFKDVWCLTLAR